MSETRGDVTGGGLAEVVLALAEAADLAATHPAFLEAYPDRRVPGLVRTADLRAAVAAATAENPRAPEATTVTEWQVQGLARDTGEWARAGDHASLGSALNGMTRLGETWARGPYGDDPTRRRIVARQRTAYADTVTEWTEADQ